MMNSDALRNGGAEKDPSLFYRNKTNDLVITDQVKALIFDLDGSLMDSMWVWSQIDAEYLAQFAISVPANLHVEIGGMSMRETAVFFKERFRIKDPVEKMLSDWNAMAWRHYCNDVYPKKGALSLLAGCKSHHIDCGIASSNSRELVDAVLRARHMDNFFGAIITGNDVMHGKPAPDIYLQAAASLGADPVHCLVFEDIPDGILAAHAAGMKCIAVQEEKSSAQEDQIKALCDDYIRDFSEIVLK